MKRIVSALDKLGEDVLKLHLRSLNTGWKEHHSNPGKSKTNESQMKQTKKPNKNQNQNKNYKKQTKQKEPHHPPEKSPNTSDLPQQCVEQKNDNLKGKNP